MKTLLKGGCVLTLDRKVGNLMTGDVLIDDGRIAEIGESLRARGAETIDCGDTIVMPGFVDAHRHTWRSLFRNSGTAADGTPIAPARYGSHHQPDDLYAATLIGLLGAVESGVTTVVDWADIPQSREHLDAVVQAHSDAGIRTVLVHPGTQAVGIDTVIDSVGVGGPTVAFGAVDVTHANLEAVDADLARARALGLRIHAHCGTAASTGAVAALGSSGLLGPDVTLVHCTRLDGPDLDAIASSDTAVALTPSSEMARGLGSPPVQEFIDREIAIGLGVDDEGLAPGDVLAQMRATISIQHATAFDLKLAGKAGIPKLMTTREVIRQGTVEGAKAAGLGGVVGSLTPGAAGDVIVLRTDRPNIFPINDPIGAVVWGVDTSNLDWVFVSGRAVMSNGALAGDVDGARQLAAKAQHRVAEAAGMLAATDTGGPA